MLQALNQRQGVDEAHDAHANGPGAGGNDRIGACVDRGHDDMVLHIAPEERDVPVWVLVPDLRQNPVDVDDRRKRLRLHHTGPVQIIKKKPRPEMRAGV